VRREWFTAKIATSFSFVLGDFDGDISPPSRDYVAFEVVLASPNASSIGELSPGSVAGVELGREGKKERSARATSSMFNSFLLFSGRFSFASKSLSESNPSRGKDWKMRESTHEISNRMGEVGEKKMRTEESWIDLSFDEGQNVKGDGRGGHSFDQK